jgi:Ala-tRNA(Pro) deacylase
MRLLFPDCQIGSEPPFGHLYGIAVVMDPCLLDGDQVYFQAGNHREVVSMGRDEFRLLARPTCAARCFHAAAAGACAPGEAHAAHV